MANLPYMENTHNRRPIASSRFEGGTMSTFGFSESTDQLDQTVTKKEPFRPHFWLMAAGLVTAIGAAAYYLLPALR